MSEFAKKEKKYPMQPRVYLNPYKKQQGGTAPKRYYKSIGLGYKTPESAIKGNYIDKKCPFTGEVSVRGRVFKGVVLKMKQEKTIVVMKNYFHYNSKYKRYERRNTKFNVHMSPCFFGLVRVGDIVTCGEVRPLSKTKRFAVVDYQKQKTRSDEYAQFFDA